MCNCGKKRSDYGAGHSVNANATNQDYPPQDAIEEVYFEYTGKTALSVKGGISGKSYRFSFSGDIQVVDLRDASGVAGIPVLKKVRKALVD